MVTTVTLCTKAADALTDPEKPAIKASSTFVNEPRRKHQFKFSLRTYILSHIDQIVDSVSSFRKISTSQVLSTRPKRTPTSCYRHGFTRPYAVDEYTYYYPVVYETCHTKLDTSDSAYINRA